MEVFFSQSNKVIILCFYSVSHSHFFLLQSGRQDPVAKLKKQLSEKEKALSDEQEAHQAIQSKLKELRAELNVEKHTNRQFEETLNARQMDLQALNARMQSLAEEKQNYSKQLQLVRVQEDNNFYLT